MEEARSVLERFERIESMSQPVGGRTSSEAERELPSFLR